MTKHIKTILERNYCRLHLACVNVPISLSLSLSIYTYMYIADISLYIYIYMCVYIYIIVCHENLGKLHPALFTILHRQPCSVSLSILSHNSACVHRVASIRRGATKIWQAVTGCDGEAASKVPGPKLIQFAMLKSMFLTVFQPGMWAATQTCAIFGPRRLSRKLLGVADPPLQGTSGTSPNSQATERASE